MSRAVKEAMLASHDLPKTERLVLIAIAAHANSDGDAWPSVATIADYVGCSARTVQRCLAKLVQMGRLVVARVAHVATRVYRLVTGQAVTSPAAGVTDSPAGAADQLPGGDTPWVSPEVEDHGKLKRAGARDWRRWIPKSKNTPGGWPERRGAALPVASRSG
ncbi:helix-turn-helix domain-containing protein [Micromonospora sp. U21]|uniref:helix-turn-helix domain-containing protein n=1 Tax=Micromonospora sp. U21 TaxID=2824899 RepID=UPI001B36BE49|nr:helix-turn-helix domain-containing protein [Micromonospora sp. U21]MBQ0900475.1 helix-turn-helix domain-containing protein [Micromonospora sp. U21]